MKTHRVLVALAGLFLLGSAPLLISAQSTPPAPASGRLAGVVVASSDDRQPVRRVIVRVSGGELARSRATVTDDLGRFAFDNLPAGRFTLTGSRPGYITSAYGATAPGRPGTPISLAAGQRVADITLRIAKGAVITGRVIDADGSPVQDVHVALLRARQAQAAATLPSPTSGVASTAVTDDRGIYRIFDLEAGEYLVAAGVAGRENEVGMLTAEQIDVGIRDLQQQRGRGAAPPRPAPVDRVASYGLAPVYHPSAVDIAEAQTIAVRAGEERTGVDLTLRVMPAVAIEGVVTGPGAEVPPVLLSLAPATASPLPSNLNARPSLSVPAGTDGKFKYVGVTPGTYVLTARTSPAGRAGGPPVAPNVNPSSPVLWASTTLTVVGTDISAIALDLRSAMSVNGRVVFQGTTATAPNGTGVRLTLAAVGVPGGYSTGMGSLVGRIPVDAVNAREDGGFQLTGVLPGTYQIGAAIKGAAVWWLRSAMFVGRDLLDVPLSVGPDTPATIGDVQVTFSDRHTELTGSLQTTSGTPAAEHFVVVFTTDRTMWRNGQRRLRSTRPATDGTFSVRDLPPGEYYIAALTDLETPWQTPDFLDQVVPASIRISIGEGQTVRQDLRLSR